MLFSQVAGGNLVQASLFSSREGVWLELGCETLQLQGNYSKLGEIHSDTEAFSPCQESLTVPSK